MPKRDVFMLRSLEMLQGSALLLSKLNEAIDVCNDSILKTLENRSEVLIILDLADLFD